jgi:hypothetical protein
MVTEKVGEDPTVDHAEVMDRPPCIERFRSQDKVLSVAKVFSWPQ